MQPELALTTEIAIFLLTFLFVLFISVTKELSGDASVRGMFQFGLAIIGLCAVVALMASSVQARKMVVADPYSTGEDWDSPESQADEPQ